MNTTTVQKLVTIGFAIAIGLYANAWADDWAEKEFKVAGGGMLSLSYPLSWGKKPAYDIFDSITDIRFGPYGPKSKPIFFVHLQAVVGLEMPSDDDLMEIAKLEVEELKKTAFETDIPINDFDGANSRGLYYSITDRESKRGEFDYLTMAVVASNQLLLKIYFLSSDGAPDFGADAMQMMQSIQYVAPLAEKDKK